MNVRGGVTGQLFNFFDGVSIHIESVLMNFSLAAALLHVICAEKN